MDRSEWDRRNAHRRLNGDAEFPWDPAATSEDRLAIMTAGDGERPPGGLARFEGEHGPELVTADGGGKVQPHRTAKAVRSPKGS